VIYVKTERSLVFFLFFPFFFLLYAFLAFFLFDSLSRSLSCFAHPALLHLSLSVSKWLSSAGSCAILAFVLEIEIRIPWLVSRRTMENAMNNCAYRTLCYQIALCLSVRPSILLLFLPPPFSILYVHFFQNEKNA